MLDDVRSRRVASAIAEPLARLYAFYHAGLVRKPTIRARILWQFHFYEAFVVLFHDTLVFLLLDVILRME